MFLWDQLLLLTSLTYVALSSRHTELQTLLQHARIQPRQADKACRDGNRKAVRLEHKGEYEGLKLGSYAPRIKPQLELDLHIVKIVDLSFQFIAVKK